jgi:PleD family two-component response regulator
MDKDVAVRITQNQGSDVLVVDDTRENLRLLIRILAENGYKVRPVTNGRMAVTAAQIVPPDLVLLDIMMPDMNGFEVCAELKADERTRDIPVIFISALDETSDKVRAFDEGGVDYITKPFEAGEVLARVNTHLTIRNLQKALQIQNTQLQEKNNELQRALSSVNTLSGLLPICAHCKKIRDDAGYWQDVEIYIRDHSGVVLSHGLCPDCIVDLYPESYPNNNKE